MSLEILLVAGVRPNIVKIAALWHAANAIGCISPKWVHTRQHELSFNKGLIMQLGLPKPDYYLAYDDKISSATELQTSTVSRIVLEFDRLLSKHRVDLVVVVGDVDSTFASSFAAARHNIPLAHVESGLRSKNRAMPEEINRILTDHLATYHFTSYESANHNLLEEGIESGSIEFVGNTMIDTLIKQESVINESTILEDLDLEGKDYSVVTFHRAGNLTNRSRLRNIVIALQYIQERTQLVIPLHRRTKKALELNGLLDKMQSWPNAYLLPPVEYIDFISLIKTANCVLTDSGGVQDETAFLGVPCLTLRDDTERPETIDIGVNRLVGTEPDSILKSFEQLGNVSRRYKKLKLTDGHASNRIMESLAKRWGLSV